jgi:hypothetical protein
MAMRTGPERATPVPGAGDWASAGEEIAVSTMAIRAIPVARAMDALRWILMRATDARTPDLAAVLKAR